MLLLCTNFMHFDDGVIVVATVGRALGNMAGRSFCFGRMMYELDWGMDTNGQGRTEKKVEVMLKIRQVCWNRFSRLSDSTVLRVFLHAENVRDQTERASLGLDFLIQHQHGSQRHAIYSFQRLTVWPKREKVNARFFFTYG